MKIIEVTSSTAVLEDGGGYRSDVFLQGDGKWKCLRCQRYRCEHALFVKQENPALKPAPTFTCDDEILTY